VLAEYKKIASTKVDPGVLLKAKFKLPFYNTSRWTFAALVGDPDGVADNIIDYIERFSPNVRDVFDGFRMVDLTNEFRRNPPLRRSDGEETPFAGHALELVSPAFLEGES
jgi:type I restriction enzyme M protein